VAGRKPIKLVAVDEDTYSKLVELRERLRAYAERRVSFNEVIKALLIRVERCRSEGK